jgi:putative hydrolase of the HAD superfamily
MITHILLDADGVIIKAHEYYSSVYAKQNNLNLEDIQPFFKEKALACKLGQADFKAEFLPYLQQWNPEENLDNYMKNWFSYEIHPDLEILKIAQSLKSIGIKIYLATDQEKYRAEYIKQIPEFSQLFDKMFFSYELGTSKEQSEFFQKVIADLNIPAEQIAYWDDEQENIDSATSIGINSFFYTGLDSFKKQLNELGIDAD